LLNREHLPFATRSWTTGRLPVCAALVLCQYIYFFPTPDRIAETMLKLARVTPNDVVYDLGSGDGRIVLLAAEKYGARAVGVELMPSLIEVSRKAARDRKVEDKVTFVQGDFFQIDISDATVVTLYLSPSVNRMLEPKLRQELRPGTRIVSHDYEIGDWTPDEVVHDEDGSDIYLWTVPKRPARAPDVPFTPTPPAVVDAMLKLARVTADDVVYDLGSGDGRVVIVAAQKYGARGVGVEIDPALVEMAREIAREGAVADRVEFLEGDFFTAPVSEASVVMLSLSEAVNRKLEEKLRRELRPGTRIVSRAFGIGDWAPDSNASAPDGTDLFLWVVPPR
jgi:ubiquinone/menaquinone biosynthesis C-methylase UbiE